MVKNGLLITNVNRVNTLDSYFFVMIELILAKCKKNTVVSMNVSLAKVTTIIIITMFKSQWFVFDR